MTLEQRLILLAQAIGADIKALNISQGALTDLDTTTKTSLVAAVNELKGIVDGLSGGGAVINDAAGDGDTTVTWSADRIFDAIAAASAALKNELTNGAGAALDTLAELAVERDRKIDAAKDTYTTTALPVQNRVKELEGQVKALSDPSDEEVLRFYTDRPELFTEPEKLHLSAIMLAVDPSSPATAWEATREEAKAIYKRLQNGADFAETARLHSSAYTETGGDMGYLHRGMLPEAMQGRIDGYEQGKINEPLETLQGMAIVRLDDRLAAKKRDFSDVAQRARDLLIRERQDLAWKGLIDKLVAKADVSFLHGVSAGSGEGGKK